MWLSHVIADGHTYYQIFNMLDRNDPVVSLTSRRNFAIMTDVIPKAMGGSSGLLFKLFAGTAVGKVLGRKCEVAVHEVNQGCVTNRKKRAESVNFRGRIGADNNDAHTHAGTYDDEIVYITPDCATQKRCGVHPRKRQPAARRHRR